MEVWAVHSFNNGGNFGDAIEGLFSSEALAKGFANSLKRALTAKNTAYDIEVARSVEVVSYEVEQIPRLYRGDPWTKPRESEDHRGRSRA